MLRPIFLCTVVSATLLAVPCSSSQGQIYINEGKYNQAIQEFSCVINAQPTEVDGYRGRIEVALLQGRFSDAVRDYQRIAAYVLPVHPEASQTIYDGYEARLAGDPNNLTALMGLSAARWWYFQYPQAIQILNQMLQLAPNSLYANLFRGSAGMLRRNAPVQGVEYLDKAIALAPSNPHVRFLVADAYTYGQPDPQRAFDEATLALNWGLDTPRIRAIRATSFYIWGNHAAAAAEIKIHLDQVTTELVSGPALLPGTSLTLALVPGRTHELSLPVTAGQAVSIATTSRTIWDTILVVLAPDGTPVVGTDDYVKYFAGLDWIAPTTATYRLRVTSFESVFTGEMAISRK